MTNERKITEIQVSARRKEKRHKYFSIFLIVAAVIFFIVVAFNNLFNIKTVEVEGISQAVSYDADDVRDFLNIKEGTNLITYDSRKAKTSLLYKFPYIEEIEIEKRFPSTLAVVITENKGTLYIDLGEDTFILSSSGRVLEINNDPFYDGKNRTRLIVDGVKRCVCGEDIVFKNEDTINVLLAIAESLESCGLSDKITHLDISDKFDVKMMYDNRFEIKFGTFEEALKKSEFLAAMMESKMWHDSTGVIDISDASEAAVRLTGNVAN